jgi:hypothetical protein
MMLLVFLIIGLGVLFIIFPRLTFGLLRIIYLFLPELTGITLFLLGFMWLSRQNPAGPFGEHRVFLTVCVIILGAVVGRKTYTMYIMPNLPRGLSNRRQDDGPH